MLRQTITKSGLAGSAPRRAFSTTIRAMASGDTGAPSKYGAASSDAFQKREKANEDYAIRQREKEKLLELKKKLAEQQAHLKKLSDHIDEITKEQGGEHN
ncbi:mitochondrial ATPase inhibitor, IATP-domain-containing protein [Microdochium trichocladiopsis]|uniref:ATPase inhibitor, mitochondrial n=1 Tax=Microdochium trichocladiopsis TaxID=1682393 RepID=A0A9P8YBC6_9PEZI|nr:mitochondrial ATPase inhibitor, IATP-domain-containing protein [Microdochium trichocladiopsis]KAH7035256.1 mitochondrial ATPase inhibitor, IATP-domain-containing protein [Microdochium trichocladiopsis]